MQKKNKKHSKFKNAGMLFELLTRQITSDILAGRDETFSKELLFKYFNENTELGKEVQLYNFIVNKKFDDKTSANFILETVLQTRSRLNEKKLRDQKYNLIKEIKSKYDINDFLKNKIPNYKLYASLYKIFETCTNETVNVKFIDVFNSKQFVLEHISTVNNKNNNSTEDLYASQPNDIKLIAYKFLIENFNKKYSAFLPKQKKLLQEYITSSSTSTGFNLFFKNELQTVLKEIKGLIGNVKDNDALKIKLNETLNQLNTKKFNSYPNESELTSLMNLYELIEELKKLNI